MFTIIGCSVLVFAYIGVHIFIFMEDNNLALYKNMDLEELNTLLMVLDGIIGALIFLGGIALNSIAIFLGIFILLMIYPLYWSVTNNKGFLYVFLNKKSKLNK